MSMEASWKVGGIRRESDSGLGGRKSETSEGGEDTQVGYRESETGEGGGRREEVDTG